MKYTVKARPYRGADYVIRTYDSIEKVRDYLKREDCVIPCSYGRAALVVFDDNKMVGCYTTQHMMNVLDD